MAVKRRCPLCVSFLGADAVVQVDPPHETMANDNPRPSAEQIERWYPRLFRTALRLTGNPHDASDLAQQAFCKALDNWEKFDHQSLRTTWLHSILRNCASDWARRRAVRATVPLDEWALVAVPDERSSAADRLEKQEQWEQVRKVIAELSEPLRRAFVATVMDGYTYLEAAELLGVPVGTVASRVSAARKEICNVMLGNMPEAQP